ncbi:hypothetical protein [Mycoplasma sp. Mirounga ES2805-ORL]|uniref:hypothetical protein n=1 Tax=Mycoplasma sp. Mirounga ES2805-ORL TaxID=754514 RepID=UPI00197B36A3|nr:hypothetical protein [Mycoplasma sp. Mirounga ES2805-ORL]QSF13498.1 hypothetical protein JXZ90_02365 [Mycoplasma sp. Mirounga ES2805-ORL]
MLKKIIFRNAFETKEVPLEKVNIILGPKGSGKSTLLRIIAQAIDNKLIYKNNEQWLDKSANLELEGAIVDELKKRVTDYDFIYDKETKNQTIENGISLIQEDLPGYITQDDKRKISLDSTEQVEVTKNQFAIMFAKTLAAQDKIKDLVHFDNLKKAMKNYSEIADGDISFNLVFKIDENIKKDKLTENLHNLDYRNDSLTEELDAKLKDLEKSISDLSLIIQSNELTLAQLKSLNHFKDNELELVSNDSIVNLNNLLEKLKKTNSELIDEYKFISNDLKKKNRALSCFAIEFEKIKKDIISKDSYENKFKRELYKIESYFENMASALIEVKKAHNKLMEEDIKLDWSIQSKESDQVNLKYKISEFVLDEDEKNEIIKYFVSSNNKTKTMKDFFIGAQSKQNYAPFTRERSVEIIKSIIKDHIDVYAGDKKYRDMSMGEKTLFGITNTIKSLPNRRNGNYLLLDQIEDNLDNRTVYEKIVPLLKAQKSLPNTQLFIVTHNSNIGTLLEGTSITTNIFNEKLDNKFVINEIIKNNGLNDIAESFYLEGGTDALNKRQQIINQKLKKANKGE